MKLTQYIDRLKEEANFQKKVSFLSPIVDKKTKMLVHMLPCSPESWVFQVPIASSSKDVHQTLSSLCRSWCLYLLRVPVWRMTPSLPILVRWGRCTCRTSWTTTPCGASSPPWSGRGPARSLPWTARCAAPQRYVIGV
jgi:hypothetical protein